MLSAALIFFVWQWQARGAQLGTNRVTLKT
jgi:hypothetical protein